MKKFLLAIVLLLYGITLLGCNGNFPELVSAIENMGEPNSFDNIYDEDNNADIEFYGDGNVIVSEDTYITLICADRDVLSMIEINYDEDIESDELSFNSITINYLDNDEKISVSVTYSSYNQWVEISKAELIRELTYFDAGDILRLLIELGLEIENELIDRVLD